MRNLIETLKNLFSRRPPMIPPSYERLSINGCVVVAQFADGSYEVVGERHNYLVSPDCKTWTRLD